MTDESKPRTKHVVNAQLHAASFYSSFSHSRLSLSSLSHAGRMPLRRPSTRRQEATRKADMEEKRGQEAARKAEMEAMAAARKLDTKVIRPA
jgi:predicted ATPase with chaperone activity